MPRLHSQAVCPHPRAIEALPPPTRQKLSYRLARLSALSEPDRRRLRQQAADCPPVLALLAQPDRSAIQTRTPVPPALLSHHLVCELVVEGELTPQELHALRCLALECPEWQKTIDGLVEHRARHYDSFPLSLWGMILAGLKDRDEAALRQLLEIYQAPIERMLARAYGQRGVAGGQAGLDEFMSWLFGTGRNHRLRYQQADGQPYRFRGFLGHWIRKFVALHAAERARHADRVDLHPAGPLVAENETAVVAEELGHHILFDALDTIRRDDPATWRAIILYANGFDWRTVSRKSGQPLTTVHQRTHRSLKKLGRYLRHHYLRDLTDSPEAAEAELDELLPVLSEALRRYAGQRGLPLLREALMARQAEVRAAAAASLARLGQEAVDCLNLLQERLADENAEVRQAAAQALGAVGGADPEIALSRLEPMLADSQPAMVRQAALRSIVQLAAEMPGPCPQGPVQALTDPDPALRRAALGLVGRLGERAGAAVPVLVDLVRDGLDDGSRRLAMEALARLGPVGLHALTELLAEPNESAATRVAAALGVGQVTPDRLPSGVLEALQQAARSDQPALRRAGQRALLQLYPTRELPP